MFIPCPGAGVATGASTFLGVTTGGVTPDTAGTGVGIGAACATGLVGTAAGDGFTGAGDGFSTVGAGAGADVGVDPGILAPGN
jgi:hypothetical protein